MRIRAEAPCRIDLAGGTLDIHPLYLFLPDACTVNLAVDVTVEVDVEDLAGGAVELESVDLGRRWSFKPGEEVEPTPGLELAARVVRHLAPEGGLSVKTRSRSQAGAGLAASSALCVALVSALLVRRGENLPTEQLVRLCLDLEAAVLGTPAGCQDFYAAAVGGLQEISFAPGKAAAKPLDADLFQIERRITLAYTGRPHRSGLDNWEVFKRFVDGDAVVRSALTEIGYAAVQMASALHSGDWNATAGLLRREWEQRKRLRPGITTPIIDALVWEAEEMGGAGKVCGAGGGGCVILWHGAEVDTRDRILSALRENDATEIPWHPDTKGCRTEVIEDRKG